MRTDVGIVGGGPAGLLLARLLGLAGIDCVVLERRDPEYLRARVRAGLLEQGTVDLLTEAGVGDRLASERLIHEGVELAFDGKRHRIDLKGLTGQVVTIYGQAEIQKDLMAAHDAVGTPVVYEAEDVSLHGLTSDKPQLRYHKAGQGHDHRLRLHRRLRRLPWHKPAGHPARGDPHLRPRLSVRLARHPLRHPPRQPRADLRQPRARLCAVHHALDDAQPLLPAGAGRRGRGGLGPTSASGPSSARESPPDAAETLQTGRRSRRAWRSCARSWPRRMPCTTACSVPGHRPSRDRDGEGLERRRPARWPMCTSGLSPWRSSRGRYLLGMATRRAA